MLSGRVQTSKITRTNDFQSRMFYLDKPSVMQTEEIKTLSHKQEVFSHGQMPQ